ncbi:MAG: endonuclease III [Candidatus Altiarchaeales archaeon ex4484_2]|nr:MAG: endonuclease III [Candidatus Altiarchaeales archaeon ex4484_2]
MSRIEEIIDILSKEFPEAGTALKYRDPLQLLVATILSAQCTDKQVNKVTKELFRKYQTAKDYAGADLEELEQDIRSTGFYRNKANNIKKCCKLLVEEYNSQVPDEMRELVKLPGVARKTANIVLSHGYGKAEGIAADTHVMRLASRLGLTCERNRDKIEEDLIHLTPKKHWILLSNLLIMHGRKTCKARKPLCKECRIRHLCPTAFSLD